MKHVSYFYLHFCSFLYPSYLPLFLCCPRKLDSSSPPHGLHVLLPTPKLLLNTLHNTCSSSWSPPKDTPNLLSPPLCFPSTSSFFYPRKSCPSIAAFPASLQAHSPPTLFCLFLSCAKGNHPWKMFWPSIIAASRMFPPSLTAKPLAS